MLTALAANEPRTLVRVATSHGYMAFWLDDVSTIEDLATGGSVITLDVTERTFVSAWDTERITREIDAAMLVQNQPTSTQQQRKAIPHWYGKLPKPYQQMFDQALKSHQPNPHQELVVMLGELLAELTLELSQHPDYRVLVGGRDMWTGVQVKQ